MRLVVSLWLFANLCLASGLRKPDFEPTLTPCAAQLRRKAVCASRVIISVAAARHIDHQRSQDHRDNTFSKSSIDNDAPTGIIRRARDTFVRRREIPARTPPRGLARRVLASTQRGQTRRFPHRDKLKSVLGSSRTNLVVSDAFVLEVYAVL